jgi:hypothetical protein
MKEGKGNHIAAQIQKINRRLGTYIVVPTARLRWSDRLRPDPFIGGGY